MWDKSNICMKGRPRLFKRVRRIISLSFDGAVHDKLQEHCYCNGINVSELVRGLVVEYLTNLNEEV